MTTEQKTAAIEAKTNEVVAVLRRDYGFVAAKSKTSNSWYLKKGNKIFRLSDHIRENYHSDQFLVNEKTDVDSLAEKIFMRSQTALGRVPKPVLTKTLKEQNEKLLKRVEQLEAELERAKPILKEIDRSARVATKSTDLYQEQKKKIKQLQETVRKLKIEREGFIIKIAKLQKQ